MKVISGGQSGVDRAALDAAIDVGIEYGGALPKGRKAEDGVVDLVKYSAMSELKDRAYAARTEYNVEHSDATVILYNVKMSGGTKLTSDMCIKHNKDVLILDIAEATSLNVLGWINKKSFKVINFAGPRESQVPGIYFLTYALLFGVFCGLNDQ